jgi:hypothetical protein
VKGVLEGDANLRVLLRRARAMSLPRFAAKAAPEQAVEKVTEAAAGRPFQSLPSWS